MINRSQLLDSVAEVLAEFPILDGHNDFPWAMRIEAAYDLDRVDISRPQPRLATDLPRLRAGRVGAQFWSVFVPGSLIGDTAVRAVLEQIDFVHRLCDRYPEAFTLVRTAQQTRAAMLNGRIASLLGAEGGHCIAGSLGVLRMLASLGVRYMTLTHNESLEWADSATDVALAHGLSPFGLEVVAEMNRLGMLVDLSHVSVETMHAALDHGRAPVVFTHSSCHGLTSHPRNVPDHVLSRLRTNGGVCMVAFVPQFVSQPVADWWAARDRIAELIVEPREVDAVVTRWATENPCPQATVQDVADHIDHAREVAGIDHVGIGGDYDGCAVMPIGLEDVSCYPILFAELASRHWDTTDLGKLANGNVLRVLEETAGD
jgi:membrane dipeptidase